MGTTRARVALGAVIMTASVLGSALPASAAGPKITAFAPASGPAGTTVQVVGSGFTGATSVKFGAASASFAVVSATLVTATVPPTAATGLVSVTTPGGTGTSKTLFVVTPLAAVSTNVGRAAPTGKVVVSGSGFAPQQATEVYFDTTQVALVSSSPTGTFSSNLTVPASAVPGTHWITAIDQATRKSAEVALTVRTNWDSFGNGPKHGGRNNLENVLNTANVDGLDTQWKVHTGGYNQSAPAIVNGVAYVGSGNDFVYALDAATGATVWSYATGGSVYTSPAVANGVVYVGSEDYKLYAFNAVNGSLLWSSFTTGMIDSSPAVVNGRVYVGSSDGALTAFDAANGNFLWTAMTSTFIDSSPAVADGIVYIGNLDGNFYAFDAATGAGIWTTSTAGYLTASPTVVGGVVYVAGGYPDGRLFAFDAATGATIWSVTSGGVADYSSPAVANGNVYVGSYGGLRAFRAATGASVWTNSAIGDTHEESPTVANGVVYITTENSGLLYAVNAATGVTLWAGAIGSSLVPPPAVANGVVYLSSYDGNGGNGGNVYAFGLAGPPAAIHRPAIASLHPNPRITLSR